MYVVRCLPRLLAAGAFCLSIPLTAASVSAQATPPPDTHQHDQHAGHEGHEQSQNEHQHGQESATMSREGSGTSWLPDDSPMYAIHLQKGSWQVMVHENVFLQYLHESGERGDSQTGSINWGMVMAQRRVGPGTLGLRAMLSLEPWTIGGCGYPDLLASGERCEGEPIHDRQHPHDLFMEMSASYDAPLDGTVRWQIYGGPAGEPALGPAAFPHRVSALANPIAPITHHWMDSTHITFGVVTAGVYDRRWKAEASAFNGREPDSHRTDFDFGALDSRSAASTCRRNPVAPAVGLHAIPARVEWIPARRWRSSVDQHGAGGVGADLRRTRESWRGGVCDAPAGSASVMRSHRR